MIESVNFSFFFAKIKFCGKKFVCSLGVNDFIDLFCGYLKIFECFFDVDVFCFGNLKFFGDK
jgi:hypothetical protein